MIYGKEFFPYSVLGHPNLFNVNTPPTNDDFRDCLRQSEWRVQTSSLKGEWGEFMASTIIVLTNPPSREWLMSWGLILKSRTVWVKQCPWRMDAKYFSTWRQNPCHHELEDVGTLLHDGTLLLDKKVPEAGVGNF